MTPRTWIIITLTLIVIATLLQIGGVVAPMWVWLENDAFHVGVGLFYRVGCEEETGAVCPQEPTGIAFDYTDANTRDRSYWIHLTWLQTVAACLSLLLLVMMVVYLVGFGVWKSLNMLNIVMVVTALFSWLCITIGLILFVVYHGLVISRSPDVSSSSFPWSALMCFLAGILLVLIAMLTRCKCRLQRYTKNAIPTSADSKMALNPSTRSHLVRRFFTPSPYREERRSALQSNTHNDESHLLTNGVTSVTHKAIGNGHTVGTDNRGYHHDEITTRITGNGYLAGTENHHFQQSGVNHRLSEELPTPLVRTAGFLQQQQQQQQQNQGVLTTTTTTTSRVVREGGRYGVQQEGGGGAGGLGGSYPLPAVTAQPAQNAADERRIHTSQVILDRHLPDDGLRKYGDVTDDAETIYYRGRGQGRSNVLYVDTGLQEEGRGHSRLLESS